MYYVIITDNWPACPGTIQLGPFRFKREAEIRLKREIEAAHELFADGRAEITGKIVKQ